jgi:hypothetical protein
MSFFPVSVPEHTLLYHGTGSPSAIKGTEWLAFEIEHAEMFAGPRGPRRNGTRPGGPGGRPPGSGPPGEGPPPPREIENDRSSDNLDDEQPLPGYLHIYRTTRRLDKLLYVDGMSAAKCSMGTLDTQDYVLRNKSTGDPNSPPFNSDYQRAKELCAEMDVEGIVRMEAGFEIIFCDFEDGIELVTAFQRPSVIAGPGGRNEISRFEYFRGVAARYLGIVGGRVQVQFSQMVSAYFYDLDLDNPNSKLEHLPRLSSVAPEALQILRSDVKAVMKRHYTAARTTPENGINWQDVVDMIVTRYHNRLPFLILDSTTGIDFLTELNFLLNLFIDYANTTDTPAAISRCETLYLSPVTPSTASDKLILASISTVTSKICHTLFSSFTLLNETHESLIDMDGNSSVVELVKDDIRDLIEWLNWSTWKECGKCAYDEVCYVAVWPFGSAEDHENPQCLNRTVAVNRRGYWNFGG